MSLELGECSKMISSILNLGSRRPAKSESWPHNNQSARRRVPRKAPIQVLTMAPMKVPVRIPTKVDLPRVSATVPMKMHVQMAEIHLHGIILRNGIKHHMKDYHASCLAVCVIERKALDL